MSKQKTDIPEGYRMTELGPLPEDWQVSPLSGVALKTKQVNPKSTPERSFKYVDVSGVDRSTLTITEHHEYTGKDAPSRARKQVKAGDVIFATVRPYLKRVAIIPEHLDQQVCSTAFCVIRVDPDSVDPKYLFFATSTDAFVARVSEYQRGSSYPAVTDKDVLRQYIALPPVSEQTRISAVLSAVQDAKEKTEGIIASLRELKKSLMKHLFTYGPVPIEEADAVELKETEIGKIPNEWTMSTLGSEGDFQYGYTASATEQNTGPRFLRITDIRDDGKVDWTNVPFAPVDKTNADKYRLRPGEILFARIGATTGKTCIIGSGCPEAVFASYLIRFKAGSKLDARYTFYYTNTERYWRLVQAGKEGKLKKGLNSQQLKSFPVPVPPLQVQTEIAETLSAIDAKLDRLENDKKSLNELFRTLLHDLMTAKIRVNDLEVPV